MSALEESIEKSVTYLRERYPADLPLLVSLEGQLKTLRARKQLTDKQLSFTRWPTK